MPPSDEGASRRPGIPERSYVVDEKILTPRRKGAQANLTPGGTARQYRILRTSETDPYDDPLQPEEVATLGLERFAGFDETFRGTSRKAAKLSIADAQVDEFEDLIDLIEAGLGPRGPRLLLRARRRYRRGVEKADARKWT